MDLHRSRTLNRVLLVGPLLDFPTRPSPTSNLALSLEQPPGYLTSVLRLRSNRASSHGHSPEPPPACLTLALALSRSFNRISLVLLLGQQLGCRILTLDPSLKQTINPLGLEQFHLRTTLDQAFNSHSLLGLEQPLPGMISDHLCNSQTLRSHAIIPRVPHPTRISPPSRHLPGRRLLLR